MIHFMLYGFTIHVYDDLRVLQNLYQTDFESKFTITAYY